MSLFFFLKGHVSTVRGLAVSPKHPYLFSCGEDRQVKCWDLEYNKVGIQMLESYFSLKKLQVGTISNSHSLINRLFAITTVTCQPFIP